MAYLNLQKTYGLSSILLAGSLAACIVGAPLNSSAEAADARPAKGWPARVNALYGIAFNGFNIGKFQFKAQVNGNNYVLIGDAKISALFGAFQWQGLTRSAGHLAKFTPRPAGYNFDFRSGKKGGSIKMSFQNGTVDNVSAVPPSPIYGTVPLEPHHLKNVLDPLSAVMAMTKAIADDPCAHRLRVFDGKQRFDLVMSYAGQTRLRRQNGSNVGYVCSVRYKPIAGFQPNDQTAKMAASTGIKIILRPIPSARLLVPHQIVIPTIAGSATITARSINIIANTTRDRIALAR